MVVSYMQVCASYMQKCKNVQSKCTLFPGSTVGFSLQFLAQKSDFKKFCSLAWLHGRRLFWSCT